MFINSHHLNRVLFLIDHNLKAGIHIGFHSHNNLQLSLSNAQELVNLQLDRTVIIDSSVHGMGRGAGNLHTELITQYINTAIEEKYELNSILDEGFVAKLYEASQAGVKIELLESTNANSSVEKFINKRGEGLHHIAFKVDDTDLALNGAFKLGFDLIDIHSRTGAENLKIGF